MIGGTREADSLPSPESAPKSCWVWLLTLLMSLHCCGYAVTIPRSPKSPSWTDRSHLTASPRFTLVPVPPCCPHVCAILLHAAARRALHTAALVPGATPAHRRPALQPSRAPHCPGRSQVLARQASPARVDPGPASSHTNSTGRLRSRSQVQPACAPPHSSSHLPSPSEGPLCSWRHQRQLQPLRKTFPHPTRPSPLGARFCSFSSSKWGVTVLLLDYHGLLRGLVAVRTDAVSV